MDVIETKLKNLNVDKKISKTLYQNLSKIFNNTKTIEEDNEITKQLLTLIYDYGITKEEIKMLLKGITKHMEHPLKEFRENGFILTSCIFKHKGFKIEKMANYEFHKELIKKILGPENKKTIEEENTVHVIKLPKRHKVKYLKYAIEILMNNEDKKFEDVFDNIVELIKRASDRTLNQAKEYLNFILIAEFDSFEKIKAISLLIQRQESLLEQVLDEIFGFYFNVKNKVDLIFSLIVYIETSESCDYRYILQKITENKKEVHHVIEKYLNVLLDKLKDRL
ncbi:hypothetical protein NBO_83g0002 [Nosema bombycis CQ1]|uniref:Uncharacterized protein n=1 Tax=Nosema bombycis (strain CQ1 / CVCC 102059) TaxID=578461 RepID=R0MKH6_NOSB1|nr:hypothetical protein NBO_83g0002 [Nosema bombycis CQ1]|eukprot:EOB13298.1 hypothetical protein NBO_83g0002 [Nosema bombycis CQ1]